MRKCAKLLIGYGLHHPCKCQEIPIATSKMPLRLCSADRALDVGALDYAPGADNSCGAQCHDKSFPGSRPSLLQPHAVTWHCDPADLRTSLQGARKLADMQEGSRKVHRPMPTECLFRQAIMLCLKCCRSIQTFCQPEHLQNVAVPQNAITDSTACSLQFPR